MDLLGPGTVVTDPARLEEYCTDAWPLAVKRAAIGEPLGKPDAVVKPRDADEVAALLAYATRNGVGVTAWGLGSSVVGGPLPEHGGIVCDMGGVAGLIEHSTEDLWVRVRAGTCGIDLETELNASGLTLGHSPQSLKRSTVGGWVATRATGQFSSYYGGIEDLVLALEVALPTGELIRTPFGPRASLGPNFAGLLVGSEGTLGIITDVTLKVSRQRPFRLLEALVFPKLQPLLQTMRDLAQSGIHPFLLRGYDPAETEYLSEGEVRGCLLLMGLEGEPAVCRAEFNECLASAVEHDGVALGPRLVERWLEHRFDFSPIERVLETPGGYAETIEVSSFWSGAGDLHSELTRALAEHADQVWGHFSHVYPQGTSLYLVLSGRASDDREAACRIEQIWHTAMEICMQRGATIVHHHGIGLARRAWLDEALGSTAAPLRAIKAALDPAGIANPGKLVDLSRT